VYIDFIQNYLLGENLECIFTQIGGHPLSTSSFIFIRKKVVLIQVKLNFRMSIVRYYLCCYLCMILWGLKNLVVSCKY